MSDESGDEVLYAVTGDVARVTVNRPARRNAMSNGVLRGLRGLRAALVTARGDEAVRVVVMTGAGRRGSVAPVIDAPGHDADRGRRGRRGRVRREAPARVQGPLMAAGYGAAILAAGTATGALR